MKNRITLLINSEGLTPSKFADKIDVARSGISHILSGRNNPSLDFIQKILNAFPTINAEWLISNKGEMYKNKSTYSLFEEEEPPKNLVKNDPPPIYKTKKQHKPYSETYKKDTNTILNTKPFVSDKKIEKIVIFYIDKTFKEYNPS